MNKALDDLLAGRTHFAPEIEDFLKIEGERTGINREKIIGVAIVLSQRKARVKKCSGEKIASVGAFSEALLLEHEEKAALKRLLKALRAADRDQLQA